MDTLPPGDYEECRWCDGEGMRIDKDNFLIICKVCGGHGYVPHGHEEPE